MSANCTAGDIGVGICYLHLVPTPYTTIFITGASTVTINGKSATLVGSVGIASCGHPTIALTGSSNSTATAGGMHRVGDVGQNGGPYVATSGSPNVTSN